MKPKTASFGFTQEEIKSVAEAISNNFATEEDATEDAINARIDAVIPILKLAQTQASRVISKAKTEAEAKAKAEAEAKAAEEAAKAAAKQNSSGEGGKGNEDDEPKWFRKYREESEARIAKLEGEKVKADRSARLKDVLKDAGSFAKHYERTFGKMKFENEEEFESFLEETKNDIAELVKEQSEKGLNIAPMGGKGTTTKAVASDAEVDALAGKFN